MSWPNPPRFACLVQEGEIMPRRDVFVTAVMCWLEINDTTVSTSHGRVHKYAHFTTGCVGTTHCLAQTRRMCNSKKRKAHKAKAARSKQPSPPKSDRDGRVLAWSAEAEAPLLWWWETDSNARTPWGVARLLGLLLRYRRLIGESVMVVFSEVFGMCRCAVLTEFHRT